MQVDERADALEQLYRDRYRTFRDVLAGIVGSHDLAREVVQEAFARALRERRRFRGEGSLDAWVWKIAVNTALKRRRVLVREEELEAEPAAGHRPTEVRLYDTDGKLLASERVHRVALPTFQQRRLPGYHLLSVPGPAIWEQRRQLFDLRADDGDRIGLWVAPSRTGGTCVWTNQSAGCSRPGEESRTPTLALGFAGAATHVTLGDTVGRDVARVEARFEDGDRLDLPPPKEGYLVWPIPARHYRLGHRLEELIAFDSSGREIAAQRFEPDTKGLYPCAKPKKLGYGVSMCP